MGLLGPALRGVSLLCPGVTGLGLGLAVAVAAVVLRTGQMISSLTPREAGGR